MIMIIVYLCSALYATLLMYCIIREITEAVIIYKIKKLYKTGRKTEAFVLFNKFIERYK